MSEFSFAKMALRTGVPFGIFMGFYQGMASHPPSVAVGAIAGTASGVVFGTTMALFVRSQYKKAALLRGQFTAEGLLFDAAANLGAKGGWLFLTKQRLVFVPHKLNFGAKRVELAVKNIAALRENSGARARGVDVGYAPEGGGTQQHSFVVEKRDEWMKAITAAVTDAGGHVKTATS